MDRARALDAGGEDGCTNSTSQPKAHIQLKGQFREYSLTHVGLSHVGLSHGAKGIGYIEVWVEEELLELQRQVIERCPAFLQQSW